MEHPRNVKRGPRKGARMEHASPYSVSQWSITFLAVSRNRLALYRYFVGVARNVLFFFLSREYVFVRYVVHNFTIELLILFGVEIFNMLIGYLNNSLHLGLFIAQNRILIAGIRSSFQRCYWKQWAHIVSRHEQTSCAVRAICRPSYFARSLSTQRNVDCSALDERCAKGDGKYQHTVYFYRMSVYLSYIYYSLIT